mgnify:CR=1 FL=1
MTSEESNMKKLILLSMIGLFAQAALASKPTWINGDLGNIPLDSKFLGYTFLEPIEMDVTQGALSSCPNTPNKTCPGSPSIRIEMKFEHLGCGDLLLPLKYKISEEKTKKDDPWDIPAFLRKKKKR